MIKIGRFTRCPRTRTRPGPECHGCSSRTTRGPETGEADAFPVSTPFCRYEELQHGPRTRRTSL